MNPDPALLAAVRTQVTARVPVDARESASREEILRGLERLPHPFDIDADPTHVTGSALMVSSRGLVLLRHKRLGIWVQPGGHVDPGETPWEAAVREGLEETGLAGTHPPGGPELVHVDAHDGGRGHRHLDLRYLLLAPPEDPDPPPGESPDCRWFSWDEAITIADDGLRGVIDQLRTATSPVPETGI